MGPSFNRRDDGPAGARMREGFSTLTPDSFARPGLATEAVEQLLMPTCGGDGPIGGTRIVTGSG